MVKNLEIFLIKKNNIFIVIVFVTSIFTTSVLYNILLKVFNLKMEFDSIQLYESFFEAFIFAVLLAPVIETFLFLYLFFQFLKTKLKSHFIIFLSALCFCIIHYPKNFSIIEILNVFIVGLIFGYAYKIFLHKNVQPFWYVATIHSLINLIGIVAYFLLPEVPN